jgi:TRAP-type C4-dicarboxylate transport system permease small subunit
MFELSPESTFFEDLSTGIFFALLALYFCWISWRIKKKNLFWHHATIPLAPAVIWTIALWIKRGDLISAMVLAGMFVGVSYIGVTIAFLLKRWKIAFLLPILFTLVCVRLSYGTISSAWGHHQNMEILDQAIKLKDRTLCGAIKENHLLKEKCLEFFKFK